MFAKRHYEAIALTMQEQHPGYSGDDYYAREQWANTVEGLSDMFARDNGQFKRDRFIAACAPGANVKLRTNYKVVS